MAAEEITTLLVLKNHGRMGRYLLSSISGLGEGVARRVLETLRNNGAIKVSKGGAEITSKGEEMLGRLLEGIGIRQIKEAKDFDRIFMCDCKRCVAALISGAISEDAVVRLRDEAIKGGSDAVLFLEYSCPENKFKILKLNSYLGDFDRDVEEILRNTLTAECGANVVILCGANYYRIIKSLIYITSSIRQA